MGVSRSRQFICRAKPLCAADVRSRFKLGRWGRDSAHKVSSWIYWRIEIVAKDDSHQSQNPSTMASVPEDFAMTIRRHTSKQMRSPEVSKVMHAAF